MNEQHWLEASDPRLMLASLRDAGKLSERKLRLFACACCRRAWHLLLDERSRQAVETAERYADKQADEGSLLSAHEGATRAYRTAQTPVSHFSSNLARLCSAPELVSRDWIADRDVDGIVVVAEVAAEAVAFAADPVRGSLTWYAAARGEQGVQCSVLRDLVGSLVRPRPALHPSCLAWGRETVVSLAAAIYDGRRWDELPVLGDALEEAGCYDWDVLSHCRRPGPHARGCWLLDAVLGRG
jgi:hypothetical protein